MLSRRSRAPISNGFIPSLVFYSSHLFFNPCLCQGELLTRLQISNTVASLPPSRKASARKRPADDTPRTMLRNFLSTGAH